LREFYLSEVEIKTELSYVEIEGKFNPAILNHGFLTKIGAMPDDAEVPEPIVIPVMASLNYATTGLKVLVDLDHFAVSRKGESADLSLPISLARSYLSTLEHTPVKHVSFGFQGQVVFPSAKGVADFEAWLLKDKSALMANLQTTRLGITIQLSYGFHDFDATVRLGPMDIKERSLIFLHCYEREVATAQGVASLLSDQKLVSRIINSAGSQLRDFCLGGITSG